MGSQIRSLVELRPDCYHNCERISLMSSFAASMFTSKIVDTEWVDAGSMNLLDIISRTWDQSPLEAVGPDRVSKLGTPVSGTTVVGLVSEYMQERHGFKANCVVAAFRGDNPSSLAGVAMKPGDIGHQ